MNIREQKMQLVFSYRRYQLDYGFGGEISEVLTDVHSIRNIIIILSLMTIVIGALVTYFISGTIASLLLL